MSIKLVLKASFLKLISNHKIRPIHVNMSPKFLILMNQNIGDMIVFSPILRELKLAFPSCNLQVMASQTNKEIAQANPYIDKVIVYKNQWHRLLPLLLELRNNKFDFAVELEAKIITKVILMLRVIQPNCILSVSKREGRYGIEPQGVHPYDCYTNVKLNHQRDTCIDILRLLKVNCVNKKYDFFYLEKNRQKSLLFLSTFESKKIIIGLNITGSSLEQKISVIDVERILLGLHSKSSNIIIILLHKPEDKKWANELISNDKSSYVFLSYPTESILDVASIVDSVDLVITPDTSIVHMACAFNKPLIAIYKRDMEGFEAWKPKSKCNYVVFSEDFESLNYIDTDTVINKSMELIKTHINKEL